VGDADRIAQKSTAEGVDAVAAQGGDGPDMVAAGALKDRVGLLAYLVAGIQTLHDPPMARYGLILVGKNYVPGCQRADH
jgi:hypothetical protein